MTATTQILAHQPLLLETEAHFNSDRPRKKRKYIPGGSGGDEADMTSDEIETMKVREERSARRRNGDRDRGRDGLGDRKRGAAPATASRPRREPRADKPTYDSAADAVAQVEGYKPREERSWEEFHPDLDLEAKITIFSADEVDGMPAVVNGDKAVTISVGDERRAVSRESPKRFKPTPPIVVASTPRRRPGRPPGRRAPAENMLNGLGIFSPPTPRPVPLLVHNPRERLSLPKPSYRNVPSLDAFEQDKAVRQSNFVTKTMEGLGYQKNDRFARTSDKEMIRLDQRSRDDELDPIILEADGVEKPTSVRATAQVEYDMDEQDQQWLDDHNKRRKEEDKVEAILPAVFEITMTQIEKEWHAIEKRIPKPNPKPPQTHRPRSGSSAAVNGEPPAQGEEQDSKCAVCDDGDCENTNAIVFCDGCDLAVHQECYGVPYIPEGQWLCRKCQQVGKALPTCIFCPNTDGAFKLTTESKWAHLVCSIWIPEVTIGNASFMEPIMNVADVAKARWKLNCYICNQKMGACIQCGNRNCYQAFHVTCARKAKLFLKMKSGQGGPASLDPSVLKAYCDKHVPSDWRNDHDVDSAVTDAKRFYRREMKGRKWADSQESALSYIPSQQNQPVESIEEMKNQDDLQHVNATPGQRKKRLEMQKKIWRLPSGAPIVPQVVFSAVDSALQKFNPLPKRKEFVAEACKYWSLKREARRGAALLKRLQLQMETFTTTEISRRDFAAMGPSGGARLERRIEFSQQLEHEMALVQELCNNLREREALKLQDAEALAELIDTVYFPITPLLRPILDRAKRLDEKTLFFTKGLMDIQKKVDVRAYTSVSAFSTDLSLALQNSSGTGEQPDAAEAAKYQQEVNKVAKRILHQTNAGGMLRVAMQSEAELAQKPYEQELKALDAILNPALNTHPHLNGDVEMTIEVENPPPKVEGSLDIVSTNGDGPHSTTDAKPPAATSNPVKIETAGPSESREHTDDLLVPLRHGGIPWYFEKFDPVGTTIHDERWDGAERAISAELSDMDEDELEGLSMGMDGTGEMPAQTKKTSNNSKARKRSRNMYW